jgi:hypothetical protein
MEIPTRMRFDWLLVVVGAGMAVLPFYFNLIVSSPTIAAILIVVGLSILIIGFGELKYQYDLELDLKESDYAKTKMEYLEHFNKNGLLNKKSHSEQVKELKKIINKK